MSWAHCHGGTPSSPHSFPLCDSLIMPFQGFNKNSLSVAQVQDSRNTEKSCPASQYTWNVRTIGYKGQDVYWRQLQNNSTFCGEWRRLSSLWSRDWGDGSAAKCIACSFRGPWFNLRHPNGGSQLSSTPVLGVPCPLLVSLGMTHRCVSRQNTHTNKRNK